MRREMKQRLICLIDSFSAQFGACPRCTRLSLISAVAAWAIAGAVIISRPNLATVVGGCFFAAALTALWIAHVIRSGTRKTLDSVLRNLGATPKEAKAIADILLQRPGLAGRNSRWLREDETLRVQFATRPAGTGLQPARVIVASENEVIAAASLSDDGSYTALDLHEIPADPVR
jgi:hypothetical protein